MSKSSIARIRRRLVKRGVDAELKRRGINPDSPEVQKWIEQKIVERESKEKGLAHGYK